MSKRMEARIFGLTIHSDTASNLSRPEAPVNGVLKALDIATASGKYEVQFALRTGEFPFLQGIGDKLTDRNRPLP